ncbi:MAG: CapA family protein [Vicinamibacterales bacterium]
MKKQVWVLSLFLAVSAAPSLGGGPPQAQGQGAAWSIAAAGDAIITRQVRCFQEDAAFMGLVGPIRAADAAAINLELALFRLWEFKGYPQVENGGNWELGPPEAADDMKWMGFDLFNYATNHTTDYGVEGMVETMRLLDSLNLVHAGAGMTAGEAAQAKYFETTKGRFAFIGLATSFTPMSRAGEPRSEIKGRPGLNALRTTSTTQLAPAEMAKLRDLVKAAGGSVPESPTASVRFGTISASPGPANRIVYTVNARDEDRILRSIRNAARQADHVIVYAHSHDIAGPSATAPAPEHLRAFIRKCLDAGADMYAVSGPHRLRGIEIYKGKPIFYSLGNFFMQNETIEPSPDDMYEAQGLGNDALIADLYDRRSRIDPKTGLATAYYSADPEAWESVVAVPEFVGDRVIRIKLYPVDMGFSMPRSQKGTPRLADTELGRKIIERMAAMSKIYGTAISFEGGIGVWEAAKSN